MHASQTKWPLWLAAALFPLKVYTIAVGSALLLWHSSGPRVPSDLAYITAYAVYGYYLVAGMLALGSLLQWFISTRAAALWSAGFAIAAITIVLLLRPYTAEGWDKLMTLTLNHSAAANSATTLVVRLVGQRGGVAGRNRSAKPL